MASNDSCIEDTVSFTSDNIAAAAPEIVQAMAQACQGNAQPYGGDALTQNVEAQLKAIFECDLQLFLVPTGSAANAISLAALTPPWGAILCHQESHINNDECGAPEFFTAGAKLIAVAGTHGKLDPQALTQAARNKRGDVHSVEPTTVSITQATEVGSIYALDELNEIGQICRNEGLKLHMDGARFANALSALGCTPAEMTWKAGVDVLSFGATKNGSLCAEAIILFDKSYAQEIAFRRKRGGHLLSKMRFLSAQMHAYLADDLWLTNARHANLMAARLAAGLSALSRVSLIAPTESNIIFCRMPTKMIAALQQQGFQFYHDRWGDGIVRLVTSFATTQAQVDTFIAAAAQLNQNTD
ncbi:threonine aldolase family protein [Neptunomonas marina]|uniref:L-threonine aldolase n=2 Tax=Neptunomonas marina TaxID=1815562 RepID=A0A437Q8X1_9GAMM|nr:low specificity L-threonine aldolase [Neptunomonas marina]RVU30998.1 low specificity L-threonine aldolase [Neptunomonas marina]